MLLSSAESLILLVLTLYVCIKDRLYLLKVIANPDILFSLVFSLSFAFAVGVSTFNFGTLVRYKIPLLPFYLLALFLINYHSNKERKLAELETIG